MIVVKVSPNCVKNADKTAISSSDLSFAIVQANAEMNVTNSHEFNMYHLYFNIQLYATTKLKFLFFYLIHTFKRGEL